MKALRSSPTFPSARRVHSLMRSCGEDLMALVSSPAMQALTKLSLSLGTSPAASLVHATIRSSLAAEAGSESNIPKLNTANLTGMLNPHGRCLTVIVVERPKVWMLTPS